MKSLIKTAAIFAIVLTFCQKGYSTGIDQQKLLELLARYDSACEQRNLPSFQYDYSKRPVRLSIQELEENCDNARKELEQWFKSINAHNKPSSAKTHFLIDNYKRLKVILGKLDKQLEQIKGKYGKSADQLKEMFGGLLDQLKERYDKSTEEERNSDEGDIAISADYIFYGIYEAIELKETQRNANHQSLCDYDFDMLDDPDLYYEYMATTPSILPSQRLYTEMSRILGRDSKSRERQDEIERNYKKAKKALYRAKKDLGLES